MFFYLEFLIHHLTFSTKGFAFHVQVVDLSGWGFEAVGGWDPGSFSLVLWVFFPVALFSNLSDYPVGFHENLVGAMVGLTFTL